MNILSIGITIGVVVGIAIGIAVAICLSLWIHIQSKENKIQNTSNEQRGMTLPIRVNAVDASSALSDDTTEYDSPPMGNDQGIFSSWFGGNEKNSILTHSGLPNYPYRDIQKATNNFTSKIGEGAFGPVYKAIMPQGGTFAVKVHSSHSKQGEKEFLAEVALLGRLHHRNLVNLVGYCAEKGNSMLVYEYMSNGSLASLLYGDDQELLTWDMRIAISQDIANGIEYLHEGAIPPIIHRDIKCANILLDGSMKARVADFGLSKEISASHSSTGVKGTYGYMDPEYISTNKFTLKSDVYSFGVLLFELITARSPQKGLMDYVGMALLSVEGEEGWEEILDERINGKCNLSEVAIVANIARQCVNPDSHNRPNMREVVQQMMKLGNKRPSSSTRSIVSDDSSQTDGDVDVRGRRDLLRLASIPERPEL